MKFALRVEYNGKNYHGWQLQKNVPSIQETLERAISDIADENINTTCAGRTDSGVHSCGQVIHFKTNSTRRKKAWIQGVNSKLPKDISVCQVKQVPNEFHARYDALTRQYQYTIYNNRYRSALLNDYTYFISKKLDEKKMHRSGQLLIGEHDFSSFRSSSCQSKNPYKKIFFLEVYRFNDLIIINIVANSFLHHMVRNIVGSLIEIGKNLKPENWTKILLSKKNRNEAGMKVHASGLNLMFVKYPKKFNIQFNLH